MNKRMTGIGLMIVGGVVFGIGLLLFINKEDAGISEIEKLNEFIDIAIADGVLTNNEKSKIAEISERQGLNPKSFIAKAEERVAKETIPSKTELIEYNKKNGDDFEKFVVSKFDKKFFRILNWAGDKYINGRYAETTPEPDIQMEFKLKDIKQPLAIECKWRKQLYKGGIEFAKPEQLARYKDFSSRKDMPVFIVIGLGGTGQNPGQLFILPLKDLDSNFLSIKELQNYRKRRNSDFFFDSKRLSLN